MTQLPRFIQISTLSTFPASLLNRDDSGLAKRIPFGGVTRTRISSQCLKRHWRMAGGPYSLESIDPELKRSLRSRWTFPMEIEQPLVEEGLTPESVVAASQVFQKELYGGKEEKVETGKGKKAKKNDVETEASPLSSERSELVVLGRPEIDFIRDAVRKIAQGSAGGADAQKRAAQYLKDHKKEFYALKYGAGVDAAMFGRFMSGDIAARVSAAVHVAHSFTVHGEESETDYFTAVDDLQIMGSGHINSTELTTGIFYTYAVIDLPLLVSNLTGCAAEAWEQADRSVAARLVYHLVHLIAETTPGAKLGSTAPYAPAWFVLAEAGSGQPHTLADAFYKPVSLRAPTGTEPGAYDPREAALKSLARYLESYDGMYGEPECRLTASMIHGEIPRAKRYVRLDDLAKALESAVWGTERE